MSPKVVNGSFAAIYDGDEFLAKAYSGIRITVNCMFLLCFVYVSLMFCRVLLQNPDSPAMRRRVRGILMSGKQFSLDSRMDLVVHCNVNSERERIAIKEDAEEGTTRDGSKASL